MFRPCDFFTFRGRTYPWWVYVVHCSSAASTPTCCLFFATPTAAPTAQQTRPQSTCLQREPRPSPTTGPARRFQGISEASVSFILVSTLTMYVDGRDVYLVMLCLLQGRHTRGAQQAGKKPSCASKGMLRTLEAAVAGLRG